MPSSTISTISIHALLAESDDADRAALCERCIFLSTLSLRRATTNIREGVTVLGVFLSTLSLRRATQALKRICGRYHKFLSTLSLRRATCAIVCIRCVRLFLSTLSLRRATSAMALNNDFRQISIHALLAESDTWEFLSQSMTCAFLSTLSLRRATLYGLCLPPVGKTFLSTLSLRRATADVVPVQYRRQDFYPRSPCGERRQGRVLIFRDFDFYPRSPCGERLAPQPVGQYDGLISIHALLAESDASKVLCATDSF